MSQLSAVLQGRTSSEAVRSTIRKARYGCRHSTRIVQKINKKISEILGK